MNEVERIAELENDGYHEAGVNCPECGVELMVRWRSIEFAGQEADEAHVVCPSCGYVDTIYDA